MKSSINQLCKKEDAPVEWKVKINSPDEEYVEKKMRVLVRSRKQSVSQEKVEEGCNVMVKAAASENKFNKPMIPITIGAGLFDGEFENALIGMKKGEEKDITVHEIAVHVTILDIRKTVFPEPTDEDVVNYCSEKEELSTIHTIAEYRQHLIDEYKDELRNNAKGDLLEAVYEYVIFKSDWNFADEDIKDFTESIIDEAKQELAAAGKDFDSVTDNDFCSILGMKDKAALQDYIDGNAEPTIASYLWYAQENNIDPEKIDIKNPDVDWTFLMDYVEGKIELIEEK